MAGREFDPTQAGGPIRQLSTWRIKVTHRGIDAVERHIGRFGNDAANQVMVNRLRRIAGGEMEPAQCDLNYYSPRMGNQDARVTFLRLIGEHDGEWGWYQFERAFPPGWFHDEPPTAKAKDILDRLESDGLVTTTPGEPQRKYRLTKQGMAALRTAAVGSTPA